MGSQGGRWGISDTDWGSAVREIRQLLIEVARRGERIAYSDLASKVETVSLGANSRPFHELLGDLSREEHEAGRPLLSALVVHKDGTPPGGGFYRMAGAIGIALPDPPEIFWAQELQRVYDYWRNH